MKSRKDRGHTLVQVDRNHMEEYVNLCPHETNISESAKDFDINWRRIAPIFPEGSLATLLLLPEKSEPAKELRDDFIIVGGMHMYPVSYTHLTLPTTERV